ncbi:MAG: DUF488 family protein [Gemmatimonadaceae bacterium]
MPFSVWTIGHSTRTADEFLAVLAAHDIELVVDVRRFAGSRRLPHFSAASLRRRLPLHGVLYHEIPSLGGRRKPTTDSINTGWRHPAFRAYADHVATEEFAAGLTELLMVANGARTAIMCAELLWWRCHRRVIADVLVSLAIPTFHIRDRGPVEQHRLSPPAHLVRGMLSYAL